MASRFFASAFLVIGLAAGAATAGDPPCVEIVPIGSFERPGLGGRHAFDGSLLYLPAYPSGVVILDVTDPAAPVQVGSFETPGRPGAIAVRSGLAVVGCEDPVGFTGLVMVDVTDPTAPTIVGQLKLPPRPNSIEIVGDLAFVAGAWEGLHVVDISDPASPGLVTTYGEDVFFVYDLFITEHMVFLVADDEFGDDPGVRIVDITDPVNPAFVGRIGARNAVDVWVDGDYAYVADDIWLLGIYDISDPSAPVRVADGVGGGDSLGSVQVRDGIAYLGEWEQGLVVVDVSDPTAPVELVHLNDDPTQHFGRAAVHNDIVYLWASDMGILTMEVGPCYVCPFDLNNDRVLDQFDLFQFVVYYTGGDERADFNGDGGLDVFDLLSYLNGFSAGCD